jgi:hypothetical protein
MSEYLTLPKSTKPKTLIIGVAGKAGSGKDLVADYLAHELNKIHGLWGRYSMATPVKEMLKIGFDLDDKDTRTETIFGITYRHFIQTLGTEWGRGCINNDIWVKTAKLRMKNKFTIISDIRFNNEADMCRDNGMIIHIRRPASKRDNSLTKSELSHSSEDPIDSKPGDIHILNDYKTVAELEAAVTDSLLSIVMAKLKKD